MRGRVPRYVVRRGRGEENKRAQRAKGYSIMQGVLITLCRYAGLAIGEIMAAVARGILTACARQMLVVFALHIFSR